MAIRIYPAVPTPKYDIESTEKFKTESVEMRSGVEQRGRIRRFSKHSHGLMYTDIPSGDVETLRNFFEDHGGQDKEFWFIDFNTRHWHDLNVGRGGPIPIERCYLASGGGVTFVDETTFAENIDSNDFKVWPVSAVNDAYYFGSIYQFDTLAFSGTAGTVSLTGVWEYNNGSIWTSGLIDTDSTSGLKSPGILTLGTSGITDWEITDVNDWNMYWIRFRLTNVVSVTSCPSGSYVETNAVTYELPGVMASGDLGIYIDSVATTAFDFTLGGGSASANRIILDSYPTQGCLITCDGTVQLKTFSVFDSDEVKESVPSKNLYSIPSIIIREVLR